MSASYIRIARTQDVSHVLTSLKARFSLLSEAEIIKYALSEVYNREMEAKMEKEQEVREVFYSAIEEGGTIGDKYLAEKGMSMNNMSEQEQYDAIFSKPKGGDENNR